MILCCESKKKCDWFGLRYPSHADLEAYAWQLGIAVVAGEVPHAAYFPAYDGLPAVIVSPMGGPLETMWAIAHELGHAVQHSGPKGPRSHSKEEHQANKWAACALIPEARIQHYGNASVDAFIGAISSHYEEIPFSDCPTRRLAARIAKYRLKALNVKASCA